jgi:putative sugar transporter
LAEINWHLPFIVYFFPVVSFFLSFYLKRDTISVAPVKVTVSGKIEVKRLVSLMSFYGLVTYLAVIVSFNLPFLMKEYHFDTGASGIIISLFYLAIMAPGFILNRVLSIFGSFTKCVSLLCMAGGMVLILLSGNEWILGLGAIFIGFGYGVIQPVVYDQTTRVATPDKVTLALAFVMSMNYLAILLCPTIIDTLQSLFHIHTQQFAFIFNLVITLLVVLGAYYRRHTFLFNDSCDNDKSLKKL